VHGDLRLFLETNVPKPGKKEKIVIGVADAKIGAAILEELGMKCSHIGVVPEVIRGILFISLNVTFFFNNTMNILIFMFKLL